ncbi:hypothetical protein WJX73_003637 [Symbiochloris irregularis]|uniref:Uncharacterized protein n=1 Tax=Symbiochloris irregularis TaxID=706552 RepID=A0AAW1NR68_9CHLO
MAGFATGTHLSSRKGPAKPKGLPALTRVQRAAAAFQGSPMRSSGLSTRTSLPKAPPNDPQRQGNIWQRYEQLEKDHRSLSSSNQELADERDRHKKTQARLEGALLDLQRQNKDMQAKLPQDSAPPLSRDSAEVLRGLSPDASGSSHTRELEASAGGAGAAENLKLLEEIRQLQARNRQLEEAASDAPRPLAGGAAFSSDSMQVATLQGRIQRLEERNRNLIAELARGQGSRPASPYGTPTATSPFAFRAAAEDADAAALRQQNESLQQQVTQLQQELSQSRPPTADAARLLELEEEVARLKGTALPPLAPGQRSPSLQRSLSKTASTGAETQTPGAPTLTKAPSIGGGVAQLQSAGSTISETEALQAYGNLQVSVSKLTSENSRLQQKVLRIESESLRTAELEEANKKLTQENMRLQSKVLRFDLGVTPPPSEAARLPSGMGEAEKQLVDELKDENAQLREDNDKLVEYLESLETKLAQGRASGGAVPVPVPAAGLEGQRSESGGMSQPLTSRGSLDSFVQLKSQNSALEDENKKLRDALKDMRSQATAAANRRNVSTIPIPVVLDSKDEVDKELWFTVEDLHAQNTQLLAQVNKLKEAQGLQGTPARDGATGDVDQLRRQVAALTESRAAEINEDNIRLINQLSEEVANLQDNTARLNRKLASGTPVSEAEALREALNTNDSLMSERNKMGQEVRRLAEKNTRLIEENETLLQRQGVGASGLSESQVAAASGAAAGAGAAAGNRSLGEKGRAASMLRRFTFGRKKDGKQSSKDTDDASSIASTDRDSNLEPLHTAGSRGSGHGDRPQTPPENLVSEVLEENQKTLEDNRRLLEENRRLNETLATVKEMEAANAELQEENKRLTEGMALVKDLTDENGRQGDEIKRLTDSLNQCLDENKTLTNRLIDAALQNDDDLFDAAFADPDDEPVAAKPPKTPKPQLDAAAQAQLEAEQAEKRRQAEAAQKRQQEMEAQAREREEQQKKDAERRAALNQRASMQLADYEKSRVTPEAYKKAKTSAFARLSQFNNKVMDARKPRGANAGGLGASSQAGSINEDAVWAPKDLDLQRPQPPAGVGAGEEALVGLHEAGRRRSQAEEAKAELARKIEGLRHGAQEPAGRDLSDRRRTTSDMIANRREAEQQADQQAMRKRANEQVRAAYYRFAGNEDVGSFMKSIGFPGFASSLSSSTGAREDFRNAIKTTADVMAGPPSSQRALAEAAHALLKDWLADYNKLHG